jgi:aldehyde:ferredoxin oxidoreductase
MKVLRVRVDRLSASMEELDDQYRNWAGRGLVASILSREVDPTCSPLGPGNKLIITNGFLAGTGVSSTGRLSVGAKSPLTGGIKESNAGGVAGDVLARLGLRAIVLEGIPDTSALHLLKVGKTGAELMPADEYRGLGTYTLAEKLHERFGRGVAVICVGPAGEHKMAIAGVAVTDKDGIPSRYAGRGGMGAVMGSKGIKAIVLEDTRETVQVNDREALRAAQKEFTSALLEHPVTGRAFPELGTIMSLDTVRALGALPVKNFGQGNLDGECPQITSSGVRETIVSRGGEGSPTHACMAGCVIRCSNVFPDAEGKALVSPLEYENLTLLGPNLGIVSLDEIASLNYLCNDYGMDTIETGVAIGVVMEAGIIPFGDYRGAVEILEEVRENTLLGKVVGQGAATVGRILGVQRIPVVKGQGISGYDPRAVKGLGVTYATSPMGADHTAGYTLFAPVKHHSPEGQVAASRNVQLFRAALDTICVCNFVMPAIVDKPRLLPDLVNAVLGTDHQPGFVAEMGKQVIRMERKFNVAAGLTRADDRLPEFMTREALAPFGLTFDVPQEEVDRIFDGIEE